MKPRMWVLYTGELRRALTPATLVVATGMALLSALTSILPLQFANQAETSLMLLVVQTSGTGLQMILVLLLAGVVANDVRSRWLRSLLTRPLTREHYLRTKMAAVYTIGMGGVLVAVVSAALYVSLGLGTVLRWDWGELALLSVLVMLQGALLTAMMAFLSCWLPGYLNLVAIAAWALVAQFLQLFAERQWWDHMIPATLVKFVFPSGFNEAIDAVSAGTHFPTAEIFWGLAALCLFLALAHFSISRIQVEKGSDE